ncbi:P-loop containing nucleoside triphosphate hydrolase protein [Schizophyllum commune H4-8]|uniref:P-loop containing nucleoside triphosphate hydrolase protein n=1 Tax=Schizophyllum commune (strain H4-8 / FGSC 9210) TaxID=578458 RepID=D8QGD9_SCHCM|nr:P-loop containing nucleoside triphosphate hydrolase protein [Schizophyllum commune H4-8]KAI5888019.1 P-loop containing nucleoside triphosphate hydrolase protein [Schizophyllum commune H4-8]
MDLGEDIDERLPGEDEKFDPSSAADTLRALDALWYIGATKKARWMDIIGDYAGEELFVIDGDSLVQRVLDDPLLALGKAGDTGFQTIHALYLVEQTLSAFAGRGCNFEIVFWDDNAPVTISSSEGDFVTTSRRLARRIIKHHCEDRLSIPVSTFANTDDEAWTEYEHQKKPMFVLLNDGSSFSDKGTLAADRMLVQRNMVLTLQHCGIPVVLLNGIEFKDSKIMSFVFEQRRVRQLPKKLPGAVARCHQRLAEETGLPRTGGQGSIVDFITIVLKKGRITPFVAELLYVFVAHLIILPSLSVSDRAQLPSLLHPKLEAALLNDFLPCVYEAAAGLACIDDVDGRVYTALLSAIVNDGHQTALANVIGSPEAARIQALWQQANGPRIDMSSFARRFSCLDKSTTSTSACSTDDGSYALLPFHEPTFDEHLSDIRVPTADETETSVVPTKYARGVIFADVHHWHNNRSILPSHLGGKPAVKRQLTPWQRKKELRAEQRFTHNLQLQAATLMGTIGLKQLVIPPAGNGAESRRAVVKGKAPASQSGAGGKGTKKSSGKGKTPKLSKKEQLLLDIQAQKDVGARKASIKSWKGHLAAMEAMSTDGKVAYLEQLNRNKVEEAWQGSELRAMRLDLLLRSWINDPQRDAPSVQDKYTVKAMRLIVDICARKVLTKAIAEKAKVVLSVLGFGEYADVLLPDEGQLEDTKMTFKFVDLLEGKGKRPAFPWMHIKEDPVEWQLRLWGEYMDRSIDATNDPRVGFRPDAWQRRVLDAIDRNSSLLVIAPTSSGKTFISYYAMEQVLRESDKGILVYIAPTKALVAQIAAEVYGRFKKTLPSGSLWAMQTRDYRIQDPQNCQILITVPEMLAIMLLSPPLAKSWTPRIKRIILDEIHSIGQQEGGAVWEQILLLAPCPVIGLSATIGSPRKFNDWLASVQRAHGYEHELVEHPHRYSHLRKYQYVLAKKPPKFQGLATYEPSERIQFLHPASMLVNGPRAMPPDLAFEASDTLSLYTVLAKRAADIDVDINDLKPSTFFKSVKALLTQKEVLEYEAALKQLLAHLIETSQQGDPDSSLALVSSDLKPPPIVCNTVDSAFAPNADEFVQNLIHLVSDLHATGSLPAIIFNFDRRYCEIIAQRLVSELERAEKAWRRSSPVWTNRIEQWEKWKAKAKDRQRQETRAKRNAGNEDEGPEQPSDTHSWQKSFDPNAPSEGFTFADVYAYSKADLDEDLRQLGWRAPGILNRLPWAFDALYRGIAVHHAGMNKHYRTLIERLFRIGYIRVMICTGTLALGINAPAKTAVFAGDSPFLTALMYRQCAGRAGRRGYDLFGNVVFYGLPEERIQRLVLSKLPSLGGTFPMTSTMCLRLVNLLHGSGNAQVAVDAVRSLMSLPHVTFTASAGRHQLLHHVRFSFEYLRQAGLLDAEGQPMNLYGVAAHLYYTEPSNFALVALLRQGILHDIAAHKSFEDAKREFIILMCHLFDRRYLSRVYTQKPHLQALLRKYPSRVLLPPLRSDAVRALREHDEEILRVFKGYAVTYAQSRDAELPKDVCLPLSHTPYVGSSESSPFKESLQRTAVPRSVRSSFIATSGHGDEFASVSELCRTARAGVELHEHSIPSMERFIRYANPDETDGVQHVLNAYIYDFYTHGQPTSLAQANGIKYGDIWYLLEDFNLVLLTLKTALQQLLSRTRSEDAELVVGVDLDEEQVVGDADVEDDVKEDEDITDEKEPAAEGEEFSRPKGVPDFDWNVYRMVSRAHEDFYAKFKAMWA